MSRPRISISFWVSLLLAIAGPGMAGCSTNPATGESTFTGLMSESDEVRIGRESHPQVLAQFGGAYEDPELNRYIDSLGQLLAHASDRPNLQYHFTVLNSPIVNAFATPGGYVYITRGLLALANSEAEVAGVLAHEIGHVAARHAAERESQAVLASIPGILTGVVTGSDTLSQAVNSGASAHLQSYSRDQEYQADLLGVRYLSRTNYDPLGMASFLTQLQANERLDAAVMGRPEMADQFSIMSTHPRTADRIQRAIQEAGVAQAANPITERDLYLSKIDGLRYGDEPAQGFIRDRLFLHPILRFVFEVPAGFHMPPLGVPAMIPDQVWAKECGACHYAFHPSLLPRASWAALMADLHDHFGEDASLPPAAAAEVAAFLQAYAAEGWDTKAARLLSNVAPTDPLRITAAPFWIRRHRRIAPAIFAAPTVKAKSNCVACHRDADSGRFDAQAIVLPDPAPSGASP